MAERIWFPWITQIHFFRNLIKSNRSQIVYILFSDWFETKLSSVWFISNRKVLNTIRFGFDSRRSGQHLCACLAPRCQCRAWSRGVRWGVCRAALCSRLHWDAKPPPPCAYVRIQIVIYCVQLFVAFVHHTVVPSSDAGAYDGGNSGML